MSDYIPFEIQMDIIKRLPMKSLISVLKQWKSLSDSSEFINNYHVTNTRSDQHHLLVSYILDSDRKYVSFVDDDNFPRNKFSHNVPLNVKKLRRVSLLGSSHGLLCLYGIYRHLNNKEMVFLWNPSIRKSVGIVVPNMLQFPSTGYTVIGFGVCPNTNNPKLVKFTHITRHPKFNSCEVFTLSSRGWRSISNNLPRKSIVLRSYSVLIDGVIYWNAYDKITGDDDEYYNLIISFDLTSEEFGVVCLSDRLLYCRSLLLFKINDSLVVLEYYHEATKPVCGVWMMKDGVKKLFTKLFTIKALNTYILNTILGFWKNGKPIIETKDNREISATLQDYDPCLKLFNNLRIRGNFSSFFVSSYTETLLLLDHPGSIIYC